MGICYNSRIFLYAMESNFIKSMKCYYYSEGIQRILGPLYYPLQMYERRKAAQKACAILCISENIKRYVANVCKHRRITVIPNIVISQKGSFKEEFKADLLYVGALGRFKGCEYLIKAMKIIVDEFSDCKLRIVGSGPKEKEFQMLTNSLDLIKNI